jgi:hypothetical protein
VRISQCWKKAKINQVSTLGFEKIALLHPLHIPLTTNK